MLDRLFGAFLEFACALCPRVNPYFTMLGRRSAVKKTPLAFLCVGQESDEAGHYRRRPGVLSTGAATRKE